MKSRYILVYVLCTGFAMHGAQQQQIEPHWKNIYSIINTLRQDYISYLKNRLIVYTTTDFTVKDFDSMKSMSTIFTTQPE